LNDKQASYQIARNGHDRPYPTVLSNAGTQDSEIQQLKATIAALTRDLDAERAKLVRATEGARLLDDRVWELQELLHKMNRTLSQRVAAAFRDLRQVCAEFVR
jgi:capsule polysaccharide export protein KpsE/RkpR